MNRIILVGNGFDLAHGLPTRYSDFIEWYWREWGEKIRGAFSSSIEDGLCSFELKEESGLHYLAYAWNGSYYQKEKPFQPWDPSLITNVSKTDDKIFNFKYKDDFFKEICDSVETKGWVDIENVYYKHLSQALLNPKSVNDCLDVVRHFLIDYLSKIQVGVTRNLINNDLLSRINEPFVKQDIALDWLHNKRLIMGFENAKSMGKAYAPERLMLINFNYTDFADRYFADIRNATIIHIHGSLSNPDSIIFGYGDELDEHYKELLNKNDNEYLRHIKSIRYLESPNYRNLLEFIESSPYQIYIMGHSCGNSDRTLLNTLFEHKNCASIKPFYHKKDDGSDNYIELAQNITRNFTDMKLLRARVVNKDYCEMLPQNNQVQFRLY